MCFPDFLLLIRIPRAVARNQNISSDGFIYSDWVRGEEDFASPLCREKRTVPDNYKGDRRTGECALSSSGASLAGAGLSLLYASVAGYCATGADPVLKTYSARTSSSIKARVPSPQVRDLLSIRTPAGVPQNARRLNVVFS